MAGSPPPLEVFEKYPNCDAKNKHFECDIFDSVKKTEIFLWYFPTSEKDVNEEVFSCSGKSVSKGGL